MKSKYLFLTFGLFFLNLKNKNYVPDKITAIKIAEAVWLPIYGNSIYEKKPFVAYLIGDTIWHVHGSLPESKIKTDTNGDTIIFLNLGGVPNVYIRKDNGTIIDVYHSK